MEALLGASYICGGINMALSTGTALGISFGGGVPWPARYIDDRFESRPTKSVIPSPLFDDLQAKLGYDFRDNTILVEALTHASLSSSKSYERLELLGDACLDLMVLDHLCNKYPQANSGALTLAKIRLIRASTLAVVAVQNLKLHQLILVNNYELNAAINVYIPLLEEITPHEIIKDGWKHEPPKVLSDVVESLIGAVLLDSGWNWEKTRCVAENIMKDMLEAVSLDLPNDPITEFYLWAAKSKCKKIRYK
jgi:endoribonuclease Dicer